MITSASNVPHGLYWWGVTPCAPWFVNRKRRAQDCPPYRSMRVGPGSPSGQTNIIRISAFDF